MVLHCPTDSNRCHPLQIVDEACSGVGFLGGIPPLGISPRSSTGLIYFATLPLSMHPSSFASIFVENLERLMEVRGQVNPLGLIDVSVHGDHPRNPSTTPFDSFLSAGRWQVLPEAEDKLKDEDGSLQIRSGHKIGGRPYLIRQNDGLLKDLESLWTLGFILAAQIDFPNAEDAIINGSWPFADGIFCLFGREPYEKSDWAWYWDF